MARPSIIFSSKETLRRLDDWRRAFKKEYHIKLSDDEIILRALDCISYKELAVADNYRRIRLIKRQRKELAAQRRKMRDK